MAPLSRVFEQGVYRHSCPGEGPGSADFAGVAFHPRTGLPSSSSVHLLLHLSSILTLDRLRYAFFEALSSPGIAAAIIADIDLAGDDVGDEARAVFAKEVEALLRYTFGQH